MIVLNFDTLDSTNKYIMEHHDSLEDFTFVSCKFQTAGKGREDRSWLSSKGENILASFLVKNTEFTSKFPLFSICTAVSIMKVLRKIGVENVSIKWPNDVYVNDKKICGILLQGQLPNFFVVGFGINVNQTIFNGEYRTAPTSIAIELKTGQDIDLIKRKVFKELERMPKHLDEYIKLAQENDYLLGKKIKYKGQVAECVGISEDCSLKVKINDSIINISSGEMSPMK